MKNFVALLVLMLLVFCFVKPICPRAGYVASSHPLTHTPSMAPGGSEDKLQTLWHDEQGPSFSGSCLFLHSYFSPLFPASRPSFENDLDFEPLKMFPLTQNSPLPPPTSITECPLNLSGHGLAVTSSWDSAPRTIITFIVSWFLLQ